MSKITKSGKTIKTSAVKENKYLTWGMFIVLLLCVFSASSYKIIDDDFFWHLSTGKYISETKTVPDTDVLGFAAPTAEWIPFEWGTDLLLYQLFTLSGYNGIFIFRSIVFCIVFVLFFRLLTALKVNSAVTIIFLFILLISFFDRLSPRPHMFTYLFLALVFYLLIMYKYIDREKYFKRLYFLPLIFLIWGNLHLGVLTGLFLVLLFLLSEIIIFKFPLKFSNKETPPLPAEHLKKIAVILAASAAVLLINPHGFKTYSYAYSHTQMKMLEQIAEWLSPFSGKIEPTFVITLYKILLFSVIVVFFYSYRKKDLTPAVLSAGFGLYSLQAIRFMVDYEIIVIPLLALSVNYFILVNLKNKFTRVLSGNPVKIILIAGLIYLSVQFQSDSFYISIKFNREAGLGISNRYFPLEMYKFIKENNIKGTPLNNFDTGGYYKWVMPDQKIFIDSRNISDDLFNEYFSILKMQPGFEPKLNKYGIDYIIFFEPKLVRFPNILKQQITEYIFNNADWALIYWDDLSMVFVKRTPENMELISKFEYKVFNPYTAVFQQKEFEADIKNFPQIADKESKRKAAAEPTGFFYGGMMEIMNKVKNSSR